MLIFSPFLYWLFCSASVSPIFAAPIPTSEFAGSTTENLFAEDHRPRSGSTSLAKRGFFTFSHDWHKIAALTAAAGIIGGVVWGASADAVKKGLGIKPEPEKKNSDGEGSSSDSQGSGKHSHYSSGTASNSNNSNDKPSLQPTSSEDSSGTANKSRTSGNASTHRHSHYSSSPASSTDSTSSGTSKQKRSVLVKRINLGFLKSPSFKSAGKFTAKEFRNGLLGGAAMLVAISAAPILWGKAKKFFGSSGEADHESEQGTADQPSKSDKDTQSNSDAEQPEGGANVNPEHPEAIQKRGLLMHRLERRILGSGLLKDLGKAATKKLSNGDTVAKATGGAVISTLGMVAGIAAGYLSLKKILGYMGIDNWANPNAVLRRKRSLPELDMRDVPAVHDIDADHSISRLAKRTAPQSGAFQKIVMAAIGLGTAIGGTMLWEKLRGKKPEAEAAGDKSDTSQTSTQPGGGAKRTISSTYNGDNLTDWPDQPSGG